MGTYTEYETCSLSGVKEAAAPFSCLSIRVRNKHTVVAEMIHTMAGVGQACWQQEVSRRNMIGMTDRSVHET